MATGLEGMQHMDRIHIWTFAVCSAAVLMAYHRLND